MSDLKRLRELAATLKFLSFIEKRLEYADEMASLIPGALDHIDSQAREIEDHKEARQLLASDLVALAEGKKVKTLLAAAVEHMLTAQAQVIEKLVEALRERKKQKEFESHHHGGV